MLRIFRTEKGATLLELMVAIVISSITLSSMMLTITQLAKYAADQKTKLLTQLQAQSIIDMITPELRMIGNGVPFHQANFLIGSSVVDTASEPILVDTATASKIQFRINETGDTYILAAAFNPGSSTTITLASVGSIKANDKIYLTNSVVDYDDGLYGTVASVNSGANTVTISSGPVYSTAAVFPIGSILEVVPTVTYNSPNDWSGITRDSGPGTVLLAPNSTMAISYLNQAGTAITLPMTSVPTTPYPANDLQNLRALNITVQVRSVRPLFSTGAIYTATANQSVAVRNFNYFY